VTEGTPLPPGWDSHVHVFVANAPVLENHYRPVARPLSEIEAVAQAHGIGHLVLVQPSVYGTDNRVLLDALQARPGRHRGIVVVDAGIADGELDAMHVLGVRGVRFNLVSPVGTRDVDAAALERLTPSLRRLGWHVQWYADAHALPRIAALQRACGLRFVLDHLAGMHALSAGMEESWAALGALADAGAWVKLSGWYRLRAQAPYAELDGLVARVASRFGSRLVWGSDWPHTSFAPAHLPDYASTWTPVPRALGEAAARAARHEAPEELYR